MSTPGFCSPRAEWHKYSHPFGLHVSGARDKRWACDSEPCASWNLTAGNSLTENNLEQETKGTKENRESDNPRVTTGAHQCKQAPLTMLPIGCDVLSTRLVCSLALSWPCTRGPLPWVWFVRGLLLQRKWDHSIPLGSSDCLSFQ